MLPHPWQGCYVVHHKEKRANLEMQACMITARYVQNSVKGNGHYQHQPREDENISSLNSHLAA